MYFWASPTQWDSSFFLSISNLTYIVLAVIRLILHGLFLLCLIFFFLGDKFKMYLKSKFQGHGILFSSLIFFFNFKNLFILFIYFWLCWVFVAARRLSLVAVSGAALCSGERASHCGGFSCCRAWALGLRASVVVARGLSCSTACGIFLDQGSNPCPLHWQVDS